MKYQYRITTDSSGTSNFGYAYLLLTNPSGSGKKLTLRSLEVYVNSIRNSVATGGISKAQARFYTIGSVLGEDMINFSSKFDSTLSIPSGIVVRRNPQVPTGVGMSSNFLTADVIAKSGAIGTQNRVVMGTNMSYGPYGGIYRGPQFSGVSDIEFLTLPQNRTLFYELIPSSTALMNNTPIRVNITLNIGGKCASWDFVTTPRPGVGIFSVENSTATTVKIVSLSFAELGTTDTPTLRLVPVGQMYSRDVNDPTKKIGVSSVQKVDSTYPNFSSFGCEVYSDVGFIPYGVPEVAISPASTGTPANLNYLQTKDFWGPTFRIMLAERNNMASLSGKSDSWGAATSHKYSDIGVRGSGIVINEGEGIAVVHTAETAVGVQAAFGAWAALSFGATVDVEPKTSPYLNLSGIVAGSDIVVLQAETSTVLTEVDSYSTTSWAWNYDPDVISTVDVCVYKSGYVPFTVRNLSLGLSGASIPVQQTIDRNYLNP